MDKMFMSIKVFAGKMGVSEKTIYRMLNDNQIPFAVKIGGQWRFRIDAVDAWLADRSGQAADAESAEVNYGITVRAALDSGMVLYRIHGDNRDETLDELLSTLPHTGELSPEIIKLSVLVRESWVSSSLKGIACMRPNQDSPFFVSRSMLILGYLEQPTDFKALDRQKTEVILLALAANKIEDVILETRLRRLLMEPDFVEALTRQLPRRELLEVVREIENRILPRRSKPS